MSKSKEKIKKNRKKGPEFLGKIIAVILAIMMLVGVAATLIFNLIG